YYGTANCCFFFSSRRRHTRFSRDWSSDVCSSDLTMPLEGLRPVKYAEACVRAMRDVVGDDIDIMVDCHARPSPRMGMLFAQALRSEERRVGKECRFRWRVNAGNESRTNQ